MFQFLFFIFGTTVGSFLSVVIIRIHDKIPGILLGRSHCPNCKHKLNVKDLIPVFSYLFFRGKCTYCSQKISFFYPLLEICTGITFVFAFYLGNEIPLNTAYFCIIFSILIASAFFDLKYKLLPDLFSILGILTGILGIYLGFGPTLWSAFLGSLIFFVFFGLQILIGFLLKKEILGIGDLILGIFLGLILGWQLTLVALFIAYLSGSIIGIIYLKFKEESLIPFAPFLVLGTFITYLWGDKIITMYLNYLQSL